MEHSQSMHMFLTHLVEQYSMYKRTAREVSGYKILDNSVIELGASVNIARLLTAAETIGANEIILPDTFQNGPETLRMMENALEELDRIYKGIENCPYKLMAVAQGKDLNEWTACYRVLIKHPNIDVIGIPKVLAKMCSQGRAHVVNNLCELDREGKEHHLLGVWYSLTEFFDYHCLSKIRSCDTVLPVYLAKNRMHPSGVRADGFTVDLNTDTVPVEYLSKINSWVHSYLPGGII